MNRPAQPYAAEIVAYTSGVKRARREYATNPTAACRKPECDELRTTDDIVCRRHRVELDADAARKVEARRRAA